MPNVELLMPKMGESVAEATIIKWLKNEGDKVDMDELLLEIATDKVDSEIPSTAAGTLTKKLFKEGDVVKVGQAIAFITTGTSIVQGKETVVETPVVTKKESSDQHQSLNLKPVSTYLTEKPTPPTPNTNATTGRFFSPLVKSIAKKEGISLAELETITGTGLGGRVTKHDIFSYLPGKGSAFPVQQSTNGSTVQIHQPTVSINSGDEIIEMDRMRKLIADHMVMSKHVSAHVTSYVEADVTNLVRWRNRVKDDFEKREKEKITFTPVFIWAIVCAIKDFPMINVSVNGTKIIKHKNINIGMATALPSGNLIVPVIKNADYLTLVGLTKTVNDLANRARNNKLLPDEVQGGTYTVTNVGSFGNVMGTPIISQPQVAIMATGAIRKKPAVIETPHGDAIAIRQMMFLSHSYDHRIVDGALGGSFVKRVAEYLEQFNINTIL